jgi:4-hydroxy-3-methylbut-2-enyl diphosphate reductase
MLATDTQEIVDFLREVIVDFYQLTKDQITSHFADTRDTLCYATNDNQSATYGLLAEDADFAIVAGGYNSSNTAHLVDLCANRLPTFFIKSSDNIISDKQIYHFDNVRKEEVVTDEFIPKKDKVRMLLTCGASCPDAVVEDILRKTVSLFPSAKSVDLVVDDWVFEKNQ